MAVQVVENQKAETSKVKSIKKAKGFKGQADEPKLKDELEEIISSNNFNSVIDVLNATVPKEKVKDMARKIITDIVIARRVPKIEKVYSIHSNDEKNGFIRSVRIKVDGYIDYNKHWTLEKYNPELDCWEEYQEPTLSLEEIKKEISELRGETQTASFDIGAISKMLDSIPDTECKDALDADGLRFLGGALKEKSELIYNHMERLWELEHKIGLLVENKEV